MKIWLTVTLASAIFLTIVSMVLESQKQASLRSKGGQVLRDSRTGLVCGAVLGAIITGAAKLDGLEIIVAILLGGLGGVLPLLVTPSRGAERDVPGLLVYIPFFTGGSLASVTICGLFQVSNMWIVPSSVSLGVFMYYLIRQTFRRRNDRGPKGL